MTCIAAVRDGRVIYMGGDSALFDEHGGHKTHCNFKKLFLRDPFLIGTSGSPKQNQHLLYADLPAFDSAVMAERVRRGPEYVMHCLANDIRAACIEADICPEDESGLRALDGELVIGFCGELYVVHEDFSVIGPCGDYASVGAGSQYAFGSLYTTGQLGALADDPRRRIVLALEAAEKHNAFVERPFVIEQIEG